MFSAAQSLTSRFDIFPLRSCTPCVIGTVLALSYDDVVLNEDMPEEGLQKIHLSSGIVKTVLKRLVGCDATEPGIYHFV